MTAFEIEVFSKVKITEIDVLSDKDREPDANPGSAIDIVWTTGNDALTMLSGRLRSWLYQKTAASHTPPKPQGDLVGVKPVSDLPNLTDVGAHIGRFGWDAEWTGYTLTIDPGLGGRSNITLTDCKVLGLKVTCKEGGSVTLNFRIEAPNISKAIHGELAMLKAREVSIVLMPPEIVQKDVEGDELAGKRSRKAREATA